MTGDGNARDHQHWYSDRGIELIGGPMATPQITVENYLKWYSPYVIFPDGRVAPLGSTPEEEAAMSDVERNMTESAYGDHVFNPKFIHAVAVRLKYYVQSEAMEMIIGRWEIEHKGNYEFDYDY